jgi:hypothetical protein
MESGGVVEGERGERERERERETGWETQRSGPRRHEKAIWLMDQGLGPKTHLEKLVRRTLELDRRHEEDWYVGIFSERGLVKQSQCPPWENGIPGVVDQKDTGRKVMEERERKKREKKKREED